MRTASTLSCTTIPPPRPMSWGPKLAVAARDQSAQHAGSGRPIAAEPTRSQPAVPLTSDAARSAARLNQQQRLQQLQLQNKNLDEPVRQQQIANPTAAIRSREPGAEPARSNHARFAEVRCGKSDERKLGARLLIRSIKELSYLHRKSLRLSAIFLLFALGAIRMHGCRRARFGARDREDSCRRASRSQERGARPVPSPARGSDLLRRSSGHDRRGDLADAPAGGPRSSDRC